MKISSQKTVHPLCSEDLLWIAKGKSVECFDPCTGILTKESGPILVRIWGCVVAVRRSPLENVWDLVY